MSCLSFVPGCRSSPPRKSVRHLEYRKAAHSTWRLYGFHSAMDQPSPHEASWICSNLLRTEWPRALARSRTWVLPCPASLMTWLESRRCRRCVYRGSLLVRECRTWRLDGRLASGVKECAPARSRLGLLWIPRLSLLGQPCRESVLSKVGVLRMFASARDLLCWRG